MLNASNLARWQFFLIVLFASGIAGSLDAGEPASAAKSSPSASRHQPAAHGYSAASAPGMDSTKVQVITLTGSGTYIFNGSPMTVQQIKQKLREAKPAVIDTPVVIRGDSRTQYQAIMNLLSTTGSAGISKAGPGPTPAREPSH